MKKVIFFLTLSVLAVLCFYGAISYTSASLQNDVYLEITNPHGLLSFFPLQDSLSVRQGENEPAFALANNLQTSIVYNLELNHAYLTPDPSEGTLYSGESIDITLNVDDYCPAGEYNLEAVLSAHFTGGKARLKAKLPLDVESGQLTLDCTNDKFFTSWNGGAAPGGTVYYYRYRDFDQEWPDEDAGWQLLEDLGTFPGTAPGEYQLKAVFGEVESAVVTIMVEPLFDDTFFNAGSFAGGFSGDGAEKEGGWDKPGRHSEDENENEDETDKENEINNIDDDTGTGHDIADRAGDGGNDDGDDSVDGNAAGGADTGAGSEETPES